MFEIKSLELLSNKKSELEPNDSNIPFMFEFREFIPIGDELETSGHETERSTGTAGREDDYDEP